MNAPNACRPDTPDAITRKQYHAHAARYRTVVLHPCSDPITPWKDTRDD